MIIMRKNNKGFTLIELLAVIIILGILMIIAIPSVTSYISDSRKSAYVDTAKELVSGTRNIVNEGNLGMYATDTTYYIPAKYIKTESGTKSPYGELTQAYIGVIYDGKGYEYYWISTDDAGQGVEFVTKSELLDTNDIKSDLTDEEILNRVKTTGIDGREKILILNEDGTWGDEYYAESFVLGEETQTIEYPNGKSKEDLVIGDVVTIGTEQFYVYKNDGTNVYLLAKYNLKVGSTYVGMSNKTGEFTSADPGYGMQCSECLGAERDYTVPAVGVLQFSESNYWDNNGTLKSGYTGSYEYPNFPYIYDNNSNLYQHITNYARKLGVNVKEARVMSFGEAIELGCNYSNYSCSNAPTFLINTTFWLGSTINSKGLLRIKRGIANFGSQEINIVYNNGETIENIAYGYDIYSDIGIRPVIVI